MCMFDTYLKVFTLNSRFIDALHKVPLCLGLATLLVEVKVKITCTCVGHCCCSPNPSHLPTPVHASPSSQDPQSVNYLALIFLPLNTCTQCPDELLVTVWSWSSHCVCPYLDAVISKLVQTSQVDSEFSCV